jgi:hypothetical protein
MTRRSLGACLGVAALLGALTPAPRCTAKPPDLPNNPPVTLAPEAPWPAPASPPLGPDAGEDGTRLMDLEAAPVPVPVTEWVQSLRRALTLGSPPLGPGLGAERGRPGASATDGDVATKDLLTPVQEASTGTLLFGVGVNSDSGLIGIIVLNERNFDLFDVPTCLANFLDGRAFRGAAPGCPTSCAPCASARGLMARLRPSEQRMLATSLLLTAHPFLALTPVDYFVADAHEPAPRFINCFQPGRSLQGLTPASAPTAPPSACPYVRQQQQAADRHVRLFAEPGLGRDVMENLRLLEEAARGMQKARALARAGQTWEALAVLEQVGQLCPGSSYDQQIGELLSEVFAGADNAPPGPEEAAEEGPEATPEDCPKCRELHAKLPAVREQVDGLMKACHQAMADGHHDKAAALAREAHALDPMTVESDPLVYKLHLLAHRAITARCGKGCLGPCEAASNPAEGPGEKPVELRKKKCPKEREIERRLEAPVNVSFNECPLRQVLEDLRDAIGIDIVIDRQALEDEGVDPDSPVSIKLESVSLKSALELVLRQVHLTYVVQDEVLWVTTEPCGRGKPVLASYEVADLLAAEDGELLYWYKSGPEGVVEFIVNAVDTRSWASQGGPGTIDFCPVTQSLLVRQAPDIQEQVNGVLTALRRHLEAERAAKKSQENGCEKPAEGAPGAALCPSLPPLDHGVVTALDEVLTESDVPGGPCGEAQEGGRSFRLVVGYSEAGLLSGCPCSLKCEGGDVLEGLQGLLGDFASEASTGGSVEVGVGPGGVRVYGKVPVGGFVLHLLYDKGVWATWPLPGPH